MAHKKGGLGRGLDSLLSDNSLEETSAAQPVILNLMEIEPNKDQARKHFDDEALSELADSIAQHGVLQPLLVRPIIGGGYQLVAGERRWRASRIAGLTQVPAIIKELSDTDAAVISLIENLQREDLNPVEEAFGFASLIKDFNLTQEEAAQRVGKSRPAVANALRLLKLPESVLDLVRENKLSAGHAKALASLNDENLIVTTAQTVIEKGLSVRETEKLVKSLTAEKKEKKKVAARNTFFDEVELSLNNSLGRKARVITKNGKESGTLEIAFFDKDDLAAIARVLEALE
ncbi:MAG: ParB/RepB/Spo0J family partition protein [Oscillospiraceae bacterium]|nr:ParB/RepB/Spo0J family partition protein [Oscillospiraceae bacterium]